MTCKLCQKPVERKCGKCGESYCKNCCRTVVGDMLMCNSCFGPLAVSTDMKDVHPIEDEEVSRRDHPEWFVGFVVEEGPLQKVTPAEYHAAAAIPMVDMIQTLKAADIRKQIETMKRDIAGLKVLLRVAEAREKKRKPRRSSATTNSTTTN